MPDKHRETNQACPEKCPSSRAGEDSKAGHQAEHRYHIKDHTFGIDLPLPRDLALAPQPGEDEPDDKHLQRDSNNASPPKVEREETPGKKPEEETDCHCRDIDADCLPSFRLGKHEAYEGNRGAKDHRSTNPCHEPGDDKRLNSGGDYDEDG